VRHVYKVFLPVQIMLQNPRHMTPSRMIDYKVVVGHTTGHRNLRTGYPEIDTTEDPRSLEVIPCTETHCQDAGNRRRYDMTISLESR
jgi:hypothetical protein